MGKEKMKTKTKMSVLAGYRVRKQLNPDAGKTGKNLKRFKKIADFS